MPSNNQSSKDLHTFTVVMTCIFCMIHAVSYLLYADHGIDLITLGGFHPESVYQGEWWRVFTSIFLHTNIAHLILNTFTFILVSEWLLRRYMTVEVLCVFFCGAFMGWVADYLVFLLYENEVTSVGASGGIMGMYTVTMYHVINRFDFKTRVEILIGLGISDIITTYMVKNMGNLEHFGGFLVGIIFAIVLTPNTGERE